MLAVTNCELKKGIKFVAQAYNLEQEIRNADVVFTGEGSFDKTTKEGKGSIFSDIFFLVDPKKISLFFFVKLMMYRKKKKLQLIPPNKRKV